MIKVSQKGKELILRKKNLVYKHMQFGKRLSPVMRNIIISGLVKMVTNNSGEFVNDMYVDFLDGQALKNSMYTQFNVDFTKKVYKSGFMVDEDELVQNLFYFTRYIISMYKKDNVGYFNYIESRRYLLNTMKDDDKRIFELRDFICELMVDTTDVYTHAYNESIMKMMAYIMAHNELLLNKELYQELLLNLRDNFSIYYDDYVNNSEKADVNNPDTIIYFFDPKEFMKKKDEGFYNKTIK